MLQTVEILLLPCLGQPPTATLTCLWSLLYSIGMDCIENITSCGSSIVACKFTGPLPSSGCSLWLCFPSRHHAIVSTFSVQGAFISLNSLIHLPQSNCSASDRLFTQREFCSCNDRTSSGVPSNFCYVQ
jgi:hypothetical protein